MLSKEVSSTIFNVFCMMRPGIEPRSPGPLVNTLPKWLKILLFIVCTQLNGFKYCDLALRILFDTNNDPYYTIEQFYLTPRWDPNRYYQSWSRVNQGVMVIKEYSKFSKSPRLEPYHHMKVIVVRGLCMNMPCILRFHPTELRIYMI